MAMRNFLYYGVILFAVIIAINRGNPENKKCTKCEEDTESCDARNNFQSEERNDNSYREERDENSENEEKSIDFLSEEINDLLMGEMNENLNSEEINEIFLSEERGESSKSEERSDNFYKEEIDKNSKSEERGESSKSEERNEGNNHKSEKLTPNDQEEIITVDSEEDSERTITKNSNYNSKDSKHNIKNSSSSNKESDPEPAGKRRKLDSHQLNFDLDNPIPSTSRARDDLPTTSQGESEINSYWSKITYSGRVAMCQFKLLYHTVLDRLGIFTIEDPENYHADNNIGRNNNPSQNYQPECFLCAETLDDNEAEGDSELHGLQEKRNLSPIHFEDVYDGEVPLDNEAPSGNEVTSDPVINPGIGQQELNDLFQVSISPRAGPSHYDDIIADNDATIKEQDATLDHIPKLDDYLGKYFPNDDSF